MKRAVLKSPALATAVLYGLASLLACAVVMWPFYAPAAHGLDVTGHQIGRDFINNWVGPQLAFGGRLSTLFDLKGYAVAIGELFGRPLPFHNWGYPPFTLLLFWPLAQAPYFVALAVWTVLFLGIYLAIGLANVEPERRLPALLLLVLSPAVIINTVGGQNGFVTASLLVGGVLLVDRRPILAGVLFGLLTAKPQLGFVLPLFLIGIRAWKTIAAACVTTAILVGASLVAFGPDPWRHYLVETSAFQLSLLKNFSGFYTSMMTSVLAEARVSGADFTAAAMVQAAVSLVVVPISAWAAIRTTDPKARVLILASAAPLATPYAFNYDLTALTLALVWRMVAQTDTVTPRDLVLRVAWLLPILIMPMNMLGAGVAPVILIATFVVAVVEAAPRSARRAVTLRPAAA